MKSDNMIEPTEVIQAVETWINSELRDISKYENRDPFDSETVYTAHQLARNIYALGVHDGIAQEHQRQVADRYRTTTRGDA